MKLISLKSSFVGSKGDLLFSITALLSLIVLCFNILFFNSLVLGVIIAPIYLFTVSLFCGNVFFPQESQRFRLLYGFIVFFCLLVVLGSIFYFFYELSNVLIVLILVVVTLALIILQRNRSPAFSWPKISPKELLSSLHIGVLDVLFLASVCASYYLLFSVRTGESIPPPLSLLPGWFFFFLVASAFILIIKIWRGKSPDGLVLFYSFILLLIPALALLIIMHQPYMTMKGAIGPEWDRQLATFGRFVSDPSLQEASKSLLGKNILQIGQSIGNVFLIKLLQVSPSWFGLYFIPFVFTLMITLAPYDLMHRLLPKFKKAALFAGLAFMATQHNIHMLTPPGKNETFALGLMLVAIFFWTKLLNEENSKLRWLFAIIITTVAVIIIHQYVGIFSIFLGAIAITFFFLQESRGGFIRLGIWIGISIGLILIWVFVYSYVLSYASHLTGGSIGGEFGFYLLTPERFIHTVAPPLWEGEAVTLYQIIFYDFINNSVYVYYGLIILGAIAAFRYRLNKGWLATTFATIILGFIFFSVVGNSHAQTESYRYYYYFTFLAFPLVSLGFFWFIETINYSVLKIAIPSNRGSQTLTTKSTLWVIGALLVAAVLISSFWGGYPRPDSSGYIHKAWQLRYPSDIDVNALEFIKSKNASNNFFIVADGHTAAAGFVRLGDLVIHTDDFHSSVYSFFEGAWGWDELFVQAVEKPIEFLPQIARYVTDKPIETTYLIFTYRLGQEKLDQVIEFYTEMLGEPVYSYGDRAYVFSFTKNQREAILTSEAKNQIVLFDDGSSGQGFWKVYRIGDGGIDFQLNDSKEIKVSGNDSLQINISKGQYQRGNLNHQWVQPLDFSSAKYLVVSMYGNGGDRAFNLYFRCQEPADDNFFYYTISDKFTGWRTLVIPLKSFKLGGQPTWEVVSQIVLQFLGQWEPGVIYLDEMMVVDNLPLGHFTNEVLLLP